MISDYSEWTDVEEHRRHSEPGHVTPGVRGPPPRHRRDDRGQREGADADEPAGVAEGVHQLGAAHEVGIERSGRTVAAIEDPALRNLWITKTYADCSAHLGQPRSAGLT